MKKKLSIILAVIITVAMAGCRSQKQPKQEVAPVQEVEQPVWNNVTMPVRVTINSPMNMTLNGTATMVRGEYALLTFRALFGIEVATVCVTPTEANLVMKMPQKLWLCEPIGDRLTRRKVSFTQLQEMMLGNRAVFEKIPGNLGITVGGTDEAPQLNLKTKAKGSSVDVTVSWDLKSARWDQPNPAQFSTPGQGYKQMTLESALKVLAQ